MALLSPSLSSPVLRLFRCGSSGIVSKMNHSEPKGSIMARSGGSARSISAEIGFFRRDLMLLGLSSPLSLLLPVSVTHAEEELKTATLVDEINAYSYTYPVELPSQKFVFKWVESRKPERYSSAAPLSPDARLRIVSERVDIIDNLIISVSIGPPNSRFITSKEKKTWTAKDVADSVLSDKSALRVTSSQRLEESSVLDAHTTNVAIRSQTYASQFYDIVNVTLVEHLSLYVSSQIDGEPYWYYEYLVRKSPTKIAQEPNLFRQYVASTAERDGYLYTISASTISKQWKKMGPFLERTVDSFRLLPPTDNYVPPYKDPWRFW